MRNKVHRPNRLARKLLDKFIPKHIGTAGLGDFDELYGMIYKENGRIKADFWYLSQVVVFYLMYLSRSISGSLMMFRSYLKIAVRNLMRAKGYSFINIFGLAVGVTCCFLIMLFIQDELSYDNFHENVDNIYRLYDDFKFQNEFVPTPIMPAVFGPAIKSEFPEILDMVRFRRFWRANRLMTYRDKKFYENRFYWVDPSVFNVLTLDLVSGNPETVLEKPYTLVITESIAEKYFGKENPVGKVLRFDNTEDFTVTGVMKDVPRNSHLKIDFLASFSSMPKQQADNSWPYLYLLLNDGVDISQLKGKIRTFLLDRFEDTQGEVVKFDFRFQHIEDIHLHSNLQYELHQNGDMTNVYVFSFIAVLILFIACINFMNLSTARSIKRSKEVGVRKVLGAERGQLMNQFMGESLFLSFTSVIVAVIFVALLLPFYNTLSGKEFSLANIDVGFTFGILILFGLGIGVLSGMYPSFILSAFKPVNTLKSNSGSDARGKILRKSLVVIQFSISILLISGTLIVSNQLDFIKDQKLGFEKERIIVVPIRSLAILTNHRAIKEELLRNANIQNVTFASSLPGDINSTFTITYRIGEQSNKPTPFVFSYFVDRDFNKVLGTSIVKGRDFSSDFGADSSAYIINEAAAKVFGLDNPIGQPIESVNYNPRKGIIVGVVKDFHFESLHRNIAPMVMSVSNQTQFGTIAIRANADGITSTLNTIKKKWSSFDSNSPFIYSFFDNDFDSLYRQEERFSTVMGYFTALAILIACLGLFGLSAFMAEQKTKEIGVRKVLGASISKLIIMLGKDFAWLVVLAFSIAVPGTYLLMNRWLQTFAYRIDLEIFTFVSAGILAFTIAFATVTYQSLKAAMADPIKSLRYE